MTFLCKYMEFKDVTYQVSDDVFITVNQCYCNGHPIIQTKKTRVQYKSTQIELNNKNAVNTRFSDTILKHGLRSIDTIEFVNYLNRVCNGYDLYSIRSNKSEVKNDFNVNDIVLKTFSDNTDLYLQKPTEVHGGVITTSQVYVDGLIQNKHVNLTNLKKLRSTKQPLCVSSFDFIHDVPIYTYIHPNLTINQEGSIHLMHLAVLFKLLSKIKSCPEFSNLTSKSILNVTMNCSQAYESAEINRLRQRIAELEKQVAGYQSQKQMPNQCKKIDTPNQSQKQMPNQCKKIDTPNQCKTFDMSEVINEICKNDGDTKTITLSMSKSKHKNMRKEELWLELDTDPDIARTVPICQFKSTNEPKDILKQESVSKLITKSLGKFCLIKRTNINQLISEFNGERLICPDLEKHRLLCKYDKLHYRQGKYNRIVYAEVDSKLVPVNSIPEAYIYKWFYRYGPGGRSFKELDDNELYRNVFTNDGDTRIKYEHL